MTHKFPRKRNRGTVVAEMPGAIWLFLIGMLFPLLGLVTLSYRVMLLYNGVRNACYQAAVQESFTDAADKAKSVLQSDVAAFTGIKVAPTEPRTRIVVRNLATSAETEFSTKLAAGSVNPQTHNYFIRIYCDAQVEPLINMGTTGFWTGIPGLTGPIQLKNFVYQTFAENPPGLES
jgi:hypothetical protein